MKKAMFRYKMAQAGYDDSVALGILLWLSGRQPIVSIEEELDAIYEYSKICTDFNNLPMFIRLTEELALKTCISYEEAVKWTVTVIAGWCR